MTLIEVFKQALREKSYLYKNTYKGDINRFSGEEKIYRNKKLVYQAIYAGGLVDQRKGD